MESSNKWRFPRMGLPQIIQIFIGLSTITITDYTPPIFIPFSMSIGISTPITQAFFGTAREASKRSVECCEHICCTWKASPAGLVEFFKYTQHNYLILYTTWYYLIYQALVESFQQVVSSSHLISSCFGGDEMRALMKTCSLKISWIRKGWKPGRIFLENGLPLTSELFPQSLRFAQEL